MIGGQRDFSLGVLASLFFLGVSLGTAYASDVTDMFAGINTRSACLESVRGLGTVSIIFKKPIDKTFRKRTGVNEEFNWDAILIAESGKETAVSLHCTKVNRGTVPGTSGKEALIQYSAEIVER